MMRARPWWWVVGVILALLVLYGDFKVVTGTRDKLDSFEGQVCQLTTASRANGSHLQTLMVTLADRAHQREELDAQAGNTTAEQADHDAAQLYELIGKLSAPQPGKGLGC